MKSSGTRLNRRGFLRGLGISLGLPVDPGVDPPSGQPRNHKDHIRLLMDMMVLAFKTDSTRISTMMLEHEGSNKSFPETGALRKV